MQFLYLMIQPILSQPIHTFLLPSIPCSDSYVAELLDHRLFLYEPTSVSSCENLSALLPLVFLAISLVDTIPHIAFCTHSCISYKNTPNTGCPVLGVHITLRGHFCFSISFSATASPRQNSGCHSSRMPMSEQTIFPHSGAEVSAICSGL